MLNMTDSLSAGDRQSEQFSNDDDDCDVTNQIKELNFEFRESLADRPEILKYIERLHTIIRRQQKKLNKFYNKLKDHRFVKYDGRTSRGTQTDEQTDPSKGEKKGIHSEPDISAPPTKNMGPWDSTEEGGSIIEEVKEAAENAMKQTSFVYEPTSGMYYDYSTGYYYNAELRMYYDGNSGRYLIYNEETKQYHFQNGEEVPSKNNTSQKRTKQCREKHKAKKPKESKCDDAEEGEITESSVSSSESDCSSDAEEDKKNDGTGLLRGDSGVGCEPCIRIIVEDTTVEKLRPGSLFMVTCKGGTMGREGDHAVLIPDINVSKHHAKFVFNPANSTYYIIDLGSRNGTWLDGERLSAALQESEAFELRHGAIIQAGGTKLLCHVHLGRDTCASCEPGLVQHVPDVPRENPVKNPEYKKQLQNLKKKFGVGNAPPDVYKVPGYEDRAEMRRNTVGSSHHSEKTHSSSLTELVLLYFYSKIMLNIAPTKFLETFETFVKFMFNPIGSIVFRTKFISEKLLINLKVKGIFRRIF
ncbi:UNVERIFIED_CONTAM: hypothetical protein PYX00_000126 [Menopon gallinae]|uniref:FHA domain-containing protein n=2 Tax=Menopon gallinae TaxID=328185 RepID=A0AAW2I8M3_9NEOP